MPNAIKGELSGNGQSEEEYKYKIYRKMIADYFRLPENQIGDKETEQFEIDVKKRFIEQPAQMKLLIVVDKLLTGFDAHQRLISTLTSQWQTTICSKQFVV